MSSRVREKLTPEREFDSLEQELFLSIVQTADLLLFDLNQLLKPRKLTNAAYNVLRILRGSGREGLPCGDIAQRMLNRDPDVTRIVDRLKSLGLVERQRQDEDRRVVRVTITKDGLKLLEELDEPVLELHSRQLSHVGRKRLRELAKLLEAARGR